MTPNFKHVMGSYKSPGPLRMDNVLMKCQSEPVEDCVRQASAPWFDIAHHDTLTAQLPPVNGENRITALPFRPGAAYLQTYRRRFLSPYHSHAGQLGYSAPGKTVSSY